MIWRLSIADWSTIAYGSNLFSNLLSNLIKQESVPPVGPIICRLTFRALVGVHVLTFKVLHGYSSLGKTSGPTTRSALAAKCFSRWCYVRSGVGVSARRIGLAMNRFYTKQTKIYGNFRIWFFLKDPKKLFVAQKINLEDTLIFGGEYSVFPNL